MRVGGRDSNNRCAPEIPSVLSEGKRAPICKDCCHEEAKEDCGEAVRWDEASQNGCEDFENKTGRSEKNRRQKTAKSCGCREAFRPTSDCRGTEGFSGDQAQSQTETGGDCGSRI